MVTLITVGNNPEGKRRCDAKCYDAMGPECDCVCGGVNHGKGLAEAQANVQELAELQVDQIAEIHGVSAGDLKIQLGLLPLGSAAESTTP